jgi:NAD-reducing hydrogenase small subunit
MSFLDMDEFLIDLAAKIEIVYSPIADIKEYPEDVDLALVEGAVDNEENQHVLVTARARTKTLVAFGDCAITGNVTAKRNSLCGPDCCLRRSYLELADITPQLPEAEGIVPRLLETVLPLHHVVDVDLFLPGCPPPADRIRKVLEQVLAGQKPVLTGKDLMFG